MNMNASPRWSRRLGQQVSHLRRWVRESSADTGSSRCTTFGLRPWGGSRSAGATAGELVGVAVRRVTGRLTTRQAPSAPSPVPAPRGHQPAARRGSADRARWVQRGVRVLEHTCRSATWALRCLSDIAVMCPRGATVPAVGGWGGRDRLAICLIFPEPGLPHDAQGLARAERLKLTLVHRLRETSAPSGPEPVVTDEVADLQDWGRRQGVGRGGWHPAGAAVMTALQRWVGRVRRERSRRPPSSASQVMFAGELLDSDARHSAAVARCGWAAETLLCAVAAG